MSAVIAEAWLLIHDERSPDEPDRIGPIRVRVDGHWQRDHHAHVIAEGLSHGAVELVRV